MVSSWQEHITAAPTYRIADAGAACRRAVEELERAMNAVQRAHREDAIDSATRYRLMDRLVDAVSLVERVDGELSFF